MSSGPAVEVLKAVLDTNIYIGAFEYPKGRNAALWNAAQAGRFRVLVSPAIVEEMAGVLRYKFGWAEDRLQKVVKAIARVAGAGIIVPRATIRAVTGDPDDDRIPECAVEGKADLIVSNDRHLLNLQEYAGIPIVAGVAFRRMLGLR